MDLAGFLEFTKSVFDDHSQFSAAFEKEIKNFKAYRKAVQKKGGKLKPYKYTEDFKPYLRKPEDRNETERKDTHEDDNTVARGKEGPNTHSTPPNGRPKRRAAEKCQASVKKTKEFENCKNKLRRPDPEPNSVPLRSSTRTLMGPTLPVIVGSPNEPNDTTSTLSVVIGPPNEPHESGSTFAIAGSRNEPGICGLNQGATSEQHRKSRRSTVNDESAGKPSKNGSEKSKLEPVVVLDKISLEMLRISVAERSPVRTSVKRLASAVDFESPRRKTLKISEEMGRVANEMQVLPQPAERRATRSRTKVLNKPPPPGSELLEIPEPRSNAAENSEHRPNAPSVSSVRTYEPTESATHADVNSFKTPKDLKFAVGTAYTTGGVIRDKENFPTILLSSGRRALLKQPLRNNNTQRSIAAPQTASKLAIRTETTVKGAHKTIPVTKEAMLIERKKKMDDAKRKAEMKRKEKLERLRLEQLKKKQLNELKARKAEERRVAQEQARNARIEQQNEEMRKAEEMRQKEMALAMKMQQLRKKLEKEKDRSAKTGIKTVSKPAVRNNEDDSDDIGLVFLDPSNQSSENANKKVAKWADRKSMRFKIALLSQTAAHSKGKAIPFFQRPEATIDTQKIFGRFARVRPRTSSAVWNTTFKFL